MRIQLTDTETGARILEDETLQAIVEALLVDGYVVLGRVIDDMVLEKMKLKLEEDTAELLRRNKEDGCKPLPRHLSQPLSPAKEHISGDVVTNPLVIQVTSEILGDGLQQHFYNGNTNMPGSEKQALHRDAPHLGPDPIHPMISIIINISPVAVDEKNGATEVWPGTHRIPGSTLVSAEAEAERRSVSPPVRMLSEKGDIVLRDPRLWHRGMPNVGTELRHMIAMVHSKRFYQPGNTIPVNRGALRSFDDPILTTKIRLVSDDFDYLSEKR